MFLPLWDQLQCRNFMFFPAVGQSHQRIKDIQLSEIGLVHFWIDLIQVSRHHAIDGDYGFAKFHRAFRMLKKSVMPASPTKFVLSYKESAFSFYDGDVNKAVISTSYLVNVTCIDLLGYFLNVHVINSKRNDGISLF